MGSKAFRGSSWWHGAVTLAWLMAAGCGHSIQVSSGGGPPPQPPGPEFVYVSNTADDVIAVFSINAKTGALTFVQQVQAETGSGLKGIVANRQLLFAADPVANEILGFTINQKDGKLTPTGQAVLNTGAGTAPTTLAIPRGSSNVYVTDTANNQLFQFSFDASGTLTSLSPGPVPTGKNPVSVAASAVLAGVFVANQADGTISGYARAKNGTLTPSGFIPSLGTANGSPMWLAADLSGAKLYDADGSGGPGGSVVVFTISSSMLTLAAAPFGTGNLVNGPLSLAIDPTFPFVYAANDGNNNTTLYMITASGLSSPQLVSGTVSANSVITDNLGKYIYVTDNTDSLLFPGSINTTNGAVTPIGSGPISTVGTSPFQVIVVELPPPS